MKWSQTQPGTRIISAADVALHLRLDTPAEGDDYLSELIDAATQYAEQAMQCSLITRTVTATFYNRLISGPEPIILPRGPIVSVTSAADANSVSVTYRLEGYGHADVLVPLQSYASPLTVAYQAGYGADGSYVPADVRQAIRSHVGSLYAYRESLSDRSLFMVPHNLEAFYARRARGTNVG